jgi:hypothetical protein
MHVRQAYEKCLNPHNGRKPEPTVKQRAYSIGGEPEQHAQAAKTINSKAAGRLLAQLFGVNMPILGVNGETVIVRTGWIIEPDAVVPRMTTIFVK